MDTEVVLNDTSTKQERRLNYRSQADPLRPLERDSALCENSDGN